MLKLININLSYNNKEILKDFNLEVKTGKHISLKGRSGKGKSSLFNIILGFTFPDSGKVIVDGEELNSDTVETFRQKIAWLPQNPDIIGKGKVLEQIIHPFDFAINKDIKPGLKLIEQEFEKLQLSKELLENDLSEVSGGEKQRIAIILAKLLNRKLLLLDEPTSALDKQSLNAVIEYIQRDSSLTVLSASHDDEWLKHCDKVIEF